MGQSLRTVCIYHVHTLSAQGGLRETHGKVDGIYEHPFTSQSKTFEHFKRLERQVVMDYGYYPGCSLTGSAHKLDKGVKQMLKKLGHGLKEIPDWNCCGALEYGDRNELVALSKENLKKAESVGKEIIAPCPACYKNLKDADSDKKFCHFEPP